MGMYRKLPVTIEAHRWFKNGDHPDDESLGVPKSEGKVVRYYRTPEQNGQNRCGKCGRKYHEHGWIETLEGGHIVCPGDWVIRGVAGEMYPCKPNIFAKTYEVVPEIKR